MEKKKYCLAGLGNPGRKYLFTRHNAGFMVADTVAAGLGLEWNENTGLAAWCRADLPDAELFFLKPLCFMNLSGTALRYIADKFRLTPSQFIVAYDDFHLPFGSIRVRPGGSAGGHNGMQSVIESMGGPGLPRIRIGIGAPPEGVDQASYVLSRFLPDEEKQLSDVISRAAGALELIISGGIEAAMNKFNGEGKASDD